MTTQLKSGYAQLESIAKERLSNETVSYGNWKKSHGTPVRKIVEGLLDMERVHLKKYGAPICADYYTFDYWVDALRAAKSLLCADHGPIDNGVIDSAICTALRRNGIDI